MVEINVNIPADASFGDVEHLLLSVTSMNDPENPPAQDIVSIDLMAALMSYIPVYFQLVFRLSLNLRRKNARYNLLPGVFFNCHN